MSWPLKVVAQSCCALVCDTRIGRSKSAPLRTHNRMATVKFGTLDMRSFAEVLTAHKDSPPGKTLVVNFSFRRVKTSAVEMGGWIFLFIFPRSHSPAETLEAVAEIELRSGER